MTVLTEGSSFGDYTVVRLLGRGGMGEVWLLEGTSGQLIAAKILDPSASADHKARRRFLREAELALGVKHPNLVETYDVGEDPESGLCYILMEYVPGGTLSDLIKANGALEIGDAVSVVWAMSNVLELGRQKGIVHRDIKPANIMFDADRTPKLADLGIARAGAAGSNTTTVTQTGMMIGTPAYMSPEQMFDSHNVDTRADIYSLGVVFFEMLTGVRPNRDDTVVQLMARAMRGEPLPDVRTLRPDVPKPLATLLERMVAPDRDKRIPTPGQITRALALIERGENFTRTRALVKTSVPCRTPRLPLRRLLWRILVSVCLVAAVTMTVLQRDRLLKELRDSRLWKSLVLKRVLPPRQPPPSPEPAPPPVPEPQPEPVPSVMPTTPVTVPFLPPSDAPTCLPPVPAVPPPALPTRPAEGPLVPAMELPTNSVPVAQPPAPAVRKAIKNPEMVYTCEFVPYYLDWMGNRKYPERIDAVEPKGHAKIDFERRRNERGGESAVVSFSGKPRELRTLTFRVEKKKGTVSVQLGGNMKARMEVKLSE